MADLEGGNGLDGLEAWAAEARARDAADARLRERWLRAQAEEGAELSSVLVGLAERRAAVVVTTTAGRQVSGTLTALGRDFVALAGPGARRTLVVLGALAAVRAVPTESRARRGRPLPSTGPDSEADDPGSSVDAAGLVDVLAQAVAERPRVTVYAGPTAVTGDLRAVGLDVLMVETAGEPPSLVYVSLAAAYEISFLDSG